MLQLYADAFVKEMMWISGVEAYLASGDPDISLKPEYAAQIYAELGGLMTDASFHGLTSIAQQAQRTMKILESKHMLIKCRELREELKNLRTRCEDKFSEVFLLHLSPSEADEFQNPTKGWESICDRFHEAIRDVEEMRKCFALNRYPASVFHSMQVIEHGLIHLGNWLRVGDYKPGWNATTRELQRISRLEPKNRTEWENKHHGFITQMEAVSHSLMTAWRHKIDHAAGRLALMPGDFAPEIADEIITATRSFMRRLALELPRDSRP